MITATHGTRADHDPAAGPKEGAMTGNLPALSKAGGPVWLDDLSREPPVSASLAKLAADDHVVGVTTNPSTFAPATADNDTHGAQIPDLPTRGADVSEDARSIIPARCPGTWIFPMGGPLARLHRGDHRRRGAWLLCGCRSRSSRVSECPRITRSM